MKRYTFYLLILLGASISGAILFLGILSVWIGMSHQEMDGHLTPVVVGSLASILVLFLFFRFSRYLFRQLNRTDAIDL
ncbi:MAG: hypothetical protein C4576_00720 [Desulfobacteraceae bacterium]|nr:MAG: hypothetical protein C4576_00720 [Desulfobacteraceae bacterium]